MGRQKSCSGLSGKPCTSQGVISCSRCERAAAHCNKPELMHYYCRSCYGTSNCKIGDSILTSDDPSRSTTEQIVLETALPPKKRQAKDISSSAKLDTKDKERLGATEAQDNDGAAIKAVDLDVNTPDNNKTIDLPEDLEQENPYGDTKDEETLGATETQDNDGAVIKAVDVEVTTPDNNETIDLPEDLEQENPYGEPKSDFESDDFVASAEDNIGTIAALEDIDENFVFDETIQFKFDTASPKHLLSTKYDDSPQSDKESVIESSSKHQHKNSCCNAKSVVDDKMYENDKFEWTESCAVINDSLPPSFSASYLYIKDKSKSDVFYMPGVSVINPPRIQRDPEIYLCALKCGVANDLNFLYSKSADVEAFFAEETDKGRCISIDVRLNPPEAMGTILPCLLKTGTEDADTKKIKKLLDKAAYSLQMWTSLSFISKAEFLAYTPSSNQGKFGKLTTPTAFGATCEASSGTKTSEPPQDNKTGTRYYSRSSTVEQRNQQIQSEGAKQTKEEKEAKQLAKMKEKIQALEDEKQNLKKINNEMKAAKKKEIDCAVSKAESKTGSKVDQLSKQLDSVQQNLVKATSKIQDLSNENADLKSKKRDLDSKLADALTSKKNIMSTPAVADSKPASTPPKLPTPASIASEYKALSSVVQETETTIAINRIQAENKIALAKLEEDKKLEEKAIDNAISLQTKKNALELLITPKPRKRRRRSSSSESSSSSSSSDSSSSSSSSSAESNSSSESSSESSRSKRHYKKTKSKKRKTGKKEKKKRKERKHKKAKKDKKR